MCKDMYIIQSWALTLFFQVRSLLNFYPWIAIALSLILLKKKTSETLLEKSTKTLDRSWNYSGLLFLKFVRSFLSVFQQFLLCSFFLISLMSEPLKILFCQFPRRSSLFFLLSAIAPKMQVRSRAKSDWAISKSDVPSSEKYI